MAYRREDFFGGAAFELRLGYAARRRDKIPRLSEGYRYFEENMDTIPVSDYKCRDKTVMEDAIFFAECRKRFIEDFRKREAAIALITKNF